MDRRHCPKDWNERVMAIRAKIAKARLDLPDDQRINEILCSSCISPSDYSLSSGENQRFFFSFIDLVLDYFSTLKIVEILKETEKESKNMFGMYSSQRMKVFIIIHFLRQKSVLNSFKGLENNSR